MYYSVYFILMFTWINVSGTVANRNLTGLPAETASQTGPTFNDVRNLSSIGCERCVLGWTGVYMQIECIVSKGEEGRAILLRNGKSVDETFRNKFKKISVVSIDYKPIEDDMGTVFTCSVPDENRTDSVRLILVQTPSVPVLSAPNAVRKFENIPLACVAHGYPAPTVSVRSSYIPLHLIYTTKTSNETSVNYNASFALDVDVTNVTCCAISGVHVLVPELVDEPSMSCTSKTINVVSPPEEMQIHEVSRTQQAINGDINITLSCEVIASKPPTEVYWTYSGRTERALPGTNSGYIKLFTFASEDNGKVVKCSAKNTGFLDLDLSIKYRVNITYEPRLQIETSHGMTSDGRAYLNATCLADANPTPFIQWCRYQSRMSEGVGTSLSLIVTTPTDGYLCRASNGVGESQMVFLQLPSTAIVQADRISDFASPTPVSDSSIHSIRVVTIAVSATSILIIVCVIALCFLFNRLRKSVRKSYNPRQHAQMPNRPACEAENNDAAPQGPSHMNAYDILALERFKQDAEPLYASVNELHAVSRLERNSIAGSSGYIPMNATRGAHVDTNCDTSSNVCAVDVAVHESPDMHEQKRYTYMYESMSDSCASTYYN